MASLPTNKAVAAYRSRFGIKPRTKTSRNLRHVTAKQVIDASKATMHEGRYLLDNSQLYTVRLCGRIVQIDQEEGHTNFIVDDGTGSLQCRIWPNTCTGFTDLTGAVLGAYYDVPADVIIIDRKLLLRAHAARPVLNHNAITAHMLAAIHEHLDLGNLTKEDLNHWDNVEREAKIYMNTTVNEETDKEAIIAALDRPIIRGSEGGGTMEYIINACHLDESTARATLEKMLNEGSIYCTISDHHFKIADNN